MRPRLWLLAGPNGSGKSSLVSTGVFAALTNTPEHPDELLRINPDQAAAALRADRADLSPDALALEAAQRSDAQLDEAIIERRPVLVETVLSSDKFIERVDRATAAGYWIGLVFMLLQHPGINVMRVAARVAQGGHDVPEDRIRARWSRSLMRLPVFARRANSFWVLDNSVKQGPARLLAERSAKSRYVSDLATALIADSEAEPLLREVLQEIVDLIGEADPAPR
ncbi:MAG: zeta toxin family protein [Pseudomonadota bacterium]